MKKPYLAVLLFGIVLLACVAVLNSCITINNELPKAEVKAVAPVVQVDTVKYIKKIAALNRKVSRLKKENKGLHWENDSMKVQLHEKDNPKIAVLDTHYYDNPFDYLMNKNN